MSYADLPVEVWEEILRVASPATTAQFLRTNTQIHTDLLTQPIQDRLNQGANSTGLIGFVAMFRSG